ncbi:hypothetical protein BGZ96_006988 [Linnemannia gamsii]|uniref:F-box domain-containing protein n=1 Tax=Linnemannia gamsii TaxID=64522 RepID=A0ABQ7K3S3_9FUNG|nr:hypothetical protein BGZ96_006988 [Linnemannia gamsii]
MNSPLPPQTQLTELAQPSPLLIPELLDNILFHLDQRTLTQTALLVSQQWLLAARRHIKLEYAWSDCLDDSGDLKHALTMLAWMSRLQWYAGSPQEVASTLSQERHWALLLSALEETVDYNQTVPERTHTAFDQQYYNKLTNYTPPNVTEWRSATPHKRLTEGLTTGLRELELHGDVEMRRFRLLLPLMPALTRLVLITSHDKRSGTRGEDETIHIRLILFHCPLLEDLHIVAGRGEVLEGPWYPTTGSLSHPEPTSLDPSISSLPLRTLILERGVVAQKDLEELLAYTPHLKSLKCLGLDTRSESSAFERLFYRLRELDIHLDSFYFPGCHFNSAISVCPDSHERTLWTTNLDRYQMKPLHNQPNIITSLEIHGSMEYSSDPDGLLHNYLCSSPHLRHLKAMALPFSLDHMDLHGLLPPVSVPRNGSRAAPRVYLPGIWQCRKLQTLHIRIATPNNMTGDPSSPLPEHSRIAFGYLVRVCPELRELRLSNGGALPDEPSLDMSLLGGFCLLGQLQHLEIFSSGTWKKQKVLSAANLEWIIESGRTVGKKLERQKYFRPIWMELGLLGGDAGGDGDLLSDDAATVARLDPTSLASIKPERSFDWSEVDPNLREELRYLGLAVEVKTFFDVLDRDEGYRCFPVMRYLSLCSPGGIELSPEREIKRVAVSKTSRPWIQLD